MLITPVQQRLCSRSGMSCTLSERVVGIATARLEFCRIIRVQEQDASHNKELG